MSEMRKYLNILEGNSYQSRVQEVANEVLRQHEATPFENKDMLKHFIEFFAKGQIEDRLGGSARKDFLKDIAVALKGKIKTKPQKSFRKPQVNLEKVAQIIEFAVGNSFPDGDPFDAIEEKLSKMGISSGDGQMIEIMNKAVKKHLGANGYFEYLAMLWDDFAQDNPDNNMDVRVDNNPWKR